jgi:ankyrin repeat domain-containing protein 50
VAVVKRLLRAGARIDLEDDIGGTALSYAVCNGHDDVLKLLVQKGAKANSEDDTIIGLLRRRAMRLLLSYYSRQAK